MKEQIKESLERLLKSVRTKSKIIVMLGTLTFGAYNNVYGSIGALAIKNKVSSMTTNMTHNTVHSVKSGIFDGYDDYDTVYFPMFDLSGINSKIVSIVEEENEPKELEIDKRPANSITPVDLELSIHKQNANRGDSITVNSQNELQCSLPLLSSGYDFGNKPITYWERDANDPNMFYLIANVRKEILQNGGVIPLPDLNGTYGSEEPYLHAQVRFNDHFVHLNDDDIVDLKDYAIFANSFGRTDITNTNRADPADVGAWADYDLDGDVDVNDLSIFTDYYLTSKKYHLEDGWILE